MFCNLVLRSMDIVNAKSIAPFIFSCLFSVLRFLGGDVIKIQSSRNLGFKGINCSKQASS